MDSASSLTNEIETKEPLLTRFSLNLDKPANSQPTQKSNEDLSRRSDNISQVGRSLSVRSSIPDGGTEGMITTSFSNQQISPALSAIHVSAGHDLTRVDSQNRADDLRLENLDISDLSLHQLARDGEVLLMEAALNRFSRFNVRTQLNKKDADHFTPLHYAARYNRLKTCRLLLQRGANIHALGEDAVTALHLVAKYKPKKEKIYGAGDADRSDRSMDDDSAAQQQANLEVLDLLISSGARVNDRDFYGLTPLHHASLRGNDSCVAKLLQCPGIAIEATDKQLMTPLHMCAVYGHVDIARRLISAGANIRCRDDENGTPLQVACSEGNLEIVKLLLHECEKNTQFETQEMLDEKDNDGNTPLHLAVDNGHFHVTNYIIDQCLSHSFHTALNAYRSNKETPLHIAARHGHMDIVTLLVDKRAKINARNDSLQTPLFLAAQFNHHQVVDFLIQCGAVIELHDQDHYTALLIAASYGHTETLAVLLQHKANVLEVDKNDKTVVYICAEEDRPDALQELLKQRKVLSLLEVADRYDNTPLHAAAMNGNFAIVKILLDAGAVIDAKNEDEQTPLHLAAHHGFVKIVKELVRRRRDIIHDDDESANTALHLAALSGRIHCIEELVRYGANIEARNAKQWTPLDCCASVGMYKSALVLLEADSPVDPKDKRKNTPLHLACTNGHTKMVELLLQWNADVTQRSVRGLNALDFAIDNSQTECARAIIASDSWREALQNRTFNHATGQHIDTPMRKLIRKMPSIAIEVFRKCMQDNDKHKDDINYQITFDYEFLDDEYSCTEWMGTDDNTSEVSVSFRDSGASTEVYRDNGKLTGQAHPYTTLSSTLMINHPLYVMVKSKRVNLMRHPLVVSLLTHKWRAYGRAVYYTNLAIYVCFLAVFNSYMLTVPPPFAIDRNRTNSTCVRVVKQAENVWGIECSPTYSSWQPIAGYIIIALAAFALFKETIQILVKRTTYLKDLTNFLEIALYILSILAVIDSTPFAKDTGIREDWQWQCGSAAVFLSWMGLLLFIQKFPRFGIFVLMFNDVFWTFISFFFVFALFILGFAFSFHVLLQNQFAFSLWWNSIIKTFVMMIGEFDYGDIFNSVFTSDSYSDRLNYSAITYILFVTFMVIMSIIIMNLLVGLAVDDIKEVQDNAVLESLAMQIKLGLEIEYKLPQFFRRRFMKKHRTFSPNSQRKRHWLIRWLTSDGHLSFQSIEDALNPEKKELEIMDEKMDNLQSRVRDLKGMVYTLNNRSQHVDNIAQAIAAHFNINWEQNEDDEEAG